MEFLSKSPEETKQITIEFASKLKPNEEKATIVGLYGELGSGKTTFMKFLAESLGIKETIQSPTFVIMKKYDLTSRFAPPSPYEGEGIKGEVFERLVHIDAYRIEKGDEMINLGWQEMVSDPSNLICIEWPERIAEILPEHIIIKFEHAGENQRKIKINNL